MSYRTHREVAEQKTQIENKMATIDRLKTVLDDVAELDDDSFNKILGLLLNDQIFQAGLNSVLISKGMTKIDFLKTKTIIDLKNPEYGLTFDLLLDAMNEIKLKDDVPLDNFKLEGSFDSRSIDKTLNMTQGFNQFQGINQLVFDD